MSDILEISTDSSNTIIWSPNDEDFADKHELSRNSDVESIVNKYITKNYLPTNGTVIENANHFNNQEDFTDENLVNVPLRLINNKQSFIDDNFSETPFIKKLKTSNENFINKFNPANSGLQDERISENRDIVTLQILSEKYRTDNIVRKTKQINDNEGKRKEKEIKKQQKIEEREKKKKEIEREKTLKQTVATANKNLKPEECMKFICVHIDNELANEEYGKDILNTLHNTEIKYKVESQIFPHTVTWTRKIHSHLIDDAGELITTAEDQDTDELLVIMNCKDFIEHVNNETLSTHIQSLKSVLVNKKITLAVFGLERYSRYQKKNKMQSQTSDNTQRQNVDWKLFKDFPNVSKQNIEFALTEIQLLCGCSHRLLEAGSEVGLLVGQFTKAIAQLPFKQQRQEKYQQTEWYASGDSRDCVKVDKNGNGLQRLWKQMLTTFPLARLETADAISSKYPTASSLMEAYDNCTTTREAELLLQNIPIRRAAGPLSSTRKIGPELSKKIYSFFTSVDGEILL